jgi:hypothetical protein
MSRGKSFLSTEFYLFAHDTQNVGFPRSNFLSKYDVEMYTSICCSEFLIFLTILKRHFNNRKHMLPSAKKPHPDY